MIISYIDGQVEVLRKRDYARGLVGSNQMAKDMPIMLRMLTASLNTLRGLRQLPTSRNSLDAIDAFYNAEAEHRSDLLNDRNLHTYAQARIGEAYNYANGHTSRIEGVFKSVVDYLKDNSKGQRLVSVVGEITVEANLSRANLSRANLSGAENASLPAGWKVTEVGLAVKE